MRVIRSVNLSMTSRKHVIPHAHKMDSKVSFLNHVRPIAEALFGADRILRKAPQALAGLEDRYFWVSRNPLGWLTI